nr:hypothetical protein [Tanacetum cinerariifolium]
IIHKNDARKYNVEVEIKSTRSPPQRTKVSPPDYHDVKDLNKDIVYLEVSPNMPPSAYMSSNPILIHFAPYAEMCVLSYGSMVWFSGLGWWFSRRMRYGSAGVVQQGMVQGTLIGSSLSETVSISA